jgi:hypothetical protein
MIGRISWGGNEEFCPTVILSATAHSFQSAIAPHVTARLMDFLALMR